jgi:hypothetical protein
MARNNLKSFPTAMLRRGLASYHPGSSNVIALAAIDPPGTQPVQPPAPVAPSEPIALSPAPVRRPITLQPETLEEVALVA